MTAMQLNAELFRAMGEIRTVINVVRDFCVRAFIRARSRSEV